MRIYFSIIYVGGNFNDMLLEYAPSGSKVSKVKFLGLGGYCIVNLNSI